MTWCLEMVLFETYKSKEAGETEMIHILRWPCTSLTIIKTEEQSQRDSIEKLHHHSSMCASHPSLTPTLPICTFLVIKRKEKKRNRLYFYTSALLSFSAIPHIHAVVFLLWQQLFLIMISNFLWIIKEKRWLFSFFAIF